MFGILKKEKDRSAAKVFCIGLNKTGTTSLEKALRDLGYRMGDQNKAHALLDSYEARNFEPLLEFCQGADAFQDAPFSYHYTFIILDSYFPNSKFILSVRNSSDEWYQSLVRFHTGLWSKSGEIPTAEELKKAGRPGGRNVLDNFIARFDVTEQDPFNKEKLVSYYENHNRMVKDYFKFKNNLLTLNVGDPAAYSEMCRFLGRKPVYDKFPWENKS